MADINEILQKAPNGPPTTTKRHSLGHSPFNFQLAFDTRKDVTKRQLRNFHREKPYETENLISFGSKKKNVTLYVCQQLMSNHNITTPISNRKINLNNTDYIKYNYQQHSLKVRV